jgi:hypothetical protein
VRTDAAGPLTADERLLLDGLLAHVFQGAAELLLQARDALANEGLQLRMRHDRLRGAGQSSAPRSR